MQGNRRHHYLLPSVSTSASPQSSHSSSSPMSLNQQQQQQQQQLLHQRALASSYNFNGLPSSRINKSTTNPKQQMPSEFAMLSKQQEFLEVKQHTNSMVQRSSNQSERQKANDTYWREQASYVNTRSPTSNREYCSSTGNFEGCDSLAKFVTDSSGPVQSMRQQTDSGSSSSNNNNNVPSAKQHDYIQQRQQEQPNEKEEKDSRSDGATCSSRSLNNATCNGFQEFEYASRLRNSRFQNNYQPITSNNQVSAQMQQQQKYSRGTCEQTSRLSSSSNPNERPSSQSNKSSGGCSINNVSNNIIKLTTNRKSPPSSSPSSSRDDRSLHVNFNRFNRVTDDDGDADGGDSRKKKYLTAKYGQQQMNLIKKRLKVETWLYEQLQELAKGSKFEAEMDNIDIDLDELLDMEDDCARRYWLKKILNPIEDLQEERVDKFIEEVLEQSRLL